MYKQTTTSNTRVMNPEQLAQRERILAKWQKEAQARAEQNQLLRAERIAKIMRQGYSYSDALLVMAAEDHPSGSVSSII